LPDKYWFSDKIVLSMYRAKEADQERKGPEMSDATGNRPARNPDAGRAPKPDRKLRRAPGQDMPRPDGTSREEPSCAS
jgi:hypothetical protein